MNRKNNPWVSLAALLLALLILVLTCTGCRAENAEATELEAPAETEPAPRFTEEHAGNYCKIITDTETGVQYLFYKYGYGGGLTKLED